MNKKDRIEKMKKRFKELMDEKEVNIITLAEILNINFSALDKFAYGNLNVSSDILLKVVDFFNVSADYLLGLDDFKNVDGKLMAVLDKIKYLEANNTTTAKEIEDLLKKEGITKEYLEMRLRI